MHYFFELCNDYVKCNFRSALNATQATNGFQLGGFRMQVRLVPEIEPARNNNNTNNDFGNDGSHWENRYTGGNNMSYQENNLVQYPNMMRAGNGNGMARDGERCRDSVSYNTPMEPFPVDVNRNNANDRDDRIFSRNSIRPPKFVRDPYCFGLSGAGIKLYHRLKDQGYSREEARDISLKRRTKPHLRGEMSNNSTSGFLSNLERARGGENNLSSRETYCAGRGGFEMPERSFSNDFDDGFSNSIQLPSNSGASNWISGRELYNEEANMDRYAGRPNERSYQRERLPERSNIVNDFTGTRNEKVNIIWS